MKLLIILILLIICISVIGIDINLRRKLKKDDEILHKLDLLIQKKEQ